MTRGDHKTEVEIFLVHDVIYSARSLAKKCVHNTTLPLISYCNLNPDGLM